MKEKKSDFDSPWKEILDCYFKDFMAYCLPEKYRQINWDKGYKMLDKELAKISRNAPVGFRVVDKLVEVYRQDGQEAFFLIHLEIQRSKVVDFEERMFVYRYRLRDLYRKPIASLAILIDNNIQWRPAVYREEWWGSYIEMGFPIIKLLDYQKRTEELEKSSNPFAHVILAQLAALERVDLNDKLAMKIHLTRRLYSFGWAKDDILSLYRFLDWIMVLPPELELEYNHEIERIEREELHVAYITTAERIGIQKGIHQGESIALLELLRDKFERIPEVYSQKIQQADSETLLKWVKKVLIAQKIEEIFED